MADIKDRITFDTFVKISEVDQVLEQDVYALMANSYRDCIVFNYGWYVFDDTKKLWVKADGGMKEILAMRVFADFKKLGKENQKQLIVLTMIKRILGKTFYDKITGFMQQHLKADIKFDKNNHECHYLNGYMDLRKNQWCERTRQQYITKVNDWNYEPSKIPENELKEARKKILDALIKIYNDNQELMDFVLIIFGYVLTGETNLQKFFIGYGKTGGNGKSQMSEWLQESFPIYMKESCKNAIEEGGNNHKSIAEMENWRSITIEEICKNKQLCASIIKNMTANKKMPYHVMHGTENNIPITWKLIGYTNYFPTFKADGGLERRLVAINFLNKFVPKNQLTNKKYLREVSVGGGKLYPIDDSLKDWMKDNTIRHAFAQLIMENAKKYYKKYSQNVDAFDKDTPECVKAFTQEILKANDKVQNFIDENLVITTNENNIIGADAMYTRYKQSSGNTYTDNRTILNDLKGKGIEYSKDKRCGGVKGCFMKVKWLSEDGEDDEKKEPQFMFDDNRQEAEKDITEIEQLKRTIAQLTAQIQKQHKPSKPVNEPELEMNVVEIDDEDEDEAYTADALAASDDEDEDKKEKMKKRLEETKQEKPKRKQTDTVKEPLKETRKKVEVPKEIKQDKTKNATAKQQEIVKVEKKPTAKAEKPKKETKGKNPKSEFTIPDL
jgi:phage/plasmid-associated DNA primase